MKSRFISQPHGKFRLGDFLKQSFQDSRWTKFRAAVAFVKYSGTKHIRDALADFSRRGKVNISVGIDAGGSSVEGLTNLIDAVENRGDIWVFHNANSSTFHPKVYLFRNDKFADLVIGSGNLTEGGLFTNYEAGVRTDIDLGNADDAAFLALIEAALDTWSAPQEGLCYKLDTEFLKQLVDREEVPTEAQTRETEEGRGGKAKGETAATRIFKRMGVPAAPAVSKQSSDLPDEAIEGENNAVIENLPLADPQPGEYRAFLMTLQRTDVGVGQLTKGTSRRSPEIFIPLAARDADPEFWGWPDQFRADSRRKGKMDRFGVQVRIGTVIVNVNMMTWPDKHDFRLRSEELRSAGSAGDILYMERSNGTGGFTYYVEVIPLGTARHAQYLSRCSNPVKNSQKLWGYV